MGEAPEKAPEEAPEKVEPGANEQEEATTVSHKVTEVTGGGGNEEEKATVAIPKLHRSHSIEIDELEHYTRWINFKLTAADKPGIKTAKECANGALLAIFIEVLIGKS